MRTLHGGWGHYEYGITGIRRRDMKRAMARRRRHAERKFASAPDHDAVVTIDANRQTGRRRHWSRDAMW